MLAMYNTVNFSFKSHLVFSTRLKFGVIFEAISGHHVSSAAVQSRL